MGKLRKVGKIEICSSSQLRELLSEKRNPNPFPPLPTPLLLGEGKGIMFLAGRGVRLKASLKSNREVYQRGQTVPHPIEKGYIFSLISPIPTNWCMTTPLNKGG
jgi:hypothetical protein